jgi:hypothetical protein
MTEFILSILSRILTTAFAPRPVVKRQGVLLLIRSGWRTAILTLGSKRRNVTIDPTNQIIRIYDRSFWVAEKREVIEFHQVQEIVYAYQDLFPANNWISHDEQDLFIVGLWLHDGRNVTLFRFYGQGQFVNNSIWPDWMMWDEFLKGKMVPHNMDSAALGLAELLSAMLDVPIGNGPL